jgi:nitrogen fixation NifU-like protein
MKIELDGCWSVYTEKVLEHYRNPRNVGEIVDADGLGIYVSESCGDITKVWIKVRDGRIVDAKFKTQGCAASIASGSMLTDMVVGKSLDEAQEITKENVASALGGLPEQKIHCSLLATDALKDAVYDYFKRKGLPLPKELEEKHRRVEAQLEKLKNMGYIMI